jgi:hypothetical protein
MSRSRVSLWPEQRETKRAQQWASVEDSVRTLLTSEGWRRWAETRAAFHE